jgi:hypothetical protein
MATGGISDLDFYGKNWAGDGTPKDLSTFTHVMRLSTNGNVGIGTTTPNYRLDVNGDAHVSGAFRLGELYFSPLQTINLAIGPERWIKLATIPNNHYVRFQIRSGSNNSEEIAELKVFGTYFNAQTGISVERQTYNDHLREVRVVGVDGYAKTVYIKIRASDYAPSVVWRAMDSKGAITVHNVEETPSGGLAHIVSGNLVAATNASIVTTRNLGVGVSNPATKLQVADDSQPWAELYWTGAASAGNKGALRFTHNRQSDGAREDLGYIQAVAENNQSNGGIRFVTRANADVETMRLTSAGNVGIGTTTPSHKLAVNGTVRAKEVIVDTGWADYVFKKGYRLAPLTEVEAHIEREGHLPGIPSAAEVEAGGVSLGDMQAKLLAKVEELTLHIIALEKRMRMLEAENTVLRANQP